MIKRVFLIVLDSFGIGGALDAQSFGDEGSNTLKTISKSHKFKVSNFFRLGLFNIDGVDFYPSYSQPVGAFGRLREMSKGKDTTVGHWEIAGVVSENKFPVYPDGFPEDIINKFREKTGRGVLCNRPYSGTAVIDRYGNEHIKTGDLIVYTSADSVFQIAAHEDIVPPDELYGYCRTAREILTGENAVGRVIARPFIGNTENGFTRTSGRHDFSLAPPRDTVLSLLQSAGYDTVGVGKINDIFAGSGISESIPTKNNADGMKKAAEILKRDWSGLCFVNLVDFDMLYGHRNDIDGYAAAAAEFDLWLNSFLPEMKQDDILMITADHGCDPGTPSTDHSREDVPLLVYGEKIKKGANIGVRESFADIGKTIADIFGLENNLDGKSFKKELSEGLI